MFDEFVTAAARSPVFQTMKSPSAIHWITAVHPWINYLLWLDVGDNISHAARRGIIALAHSMTYLWLPCLVCRIQRLRHSNRGHGAVAAYVAVQVKFVNESANKELQAQFDPKVLCLSWQIL